MIIAYFLLVIMIILFIIGIPQIIAGEIELWTDAKKNGWKSP